MKKALIIAMAVIAIAGCTVKKDMYAMGGSKADGTIRMGYTYDEFEKPMVDMKQGGVLAAQKCKIWGYESAEPFGGVVEHCTTISLGGCKTMTAYVEYQCTGGKSAQF